LERLAGALGLPRTASSRDLDAAKAIEIMRSLAGPSMTDVLAALESEATARELAIRGGAATRPKRRGADRTAFMKWICGHLTRAFPKAPYAALVRVGTPVLEAAYPVALNDDYDDALTQELKRQRARLRCNNRGT
jgi:hypothetical protein